MSKIPVDSMAAQHWRIETALKDSAGVLLAWPAESKLLLAAIMDRAGEGEIFSIKIAAHQVPGHVFTGKATAVGATTGPGPR